METFSTNTSCPISTAPITTSNNGNNQGIGEKIAQHSTTDPIINNNKSQQQKHQRRLARRGISSRPFSDKTKIHNNNYCTVDSAAAAAPAAGNPIGLNVPVKPSNKSSTSRSYSMAEHDPKAFAQILSEKLQRLLNSQLVTERLDNLMIETSPNIQESQEQVNETTNLMITDYNNNKSNKDEPSIISNTSTVITFTTTNCPIVTNTTNINETTTIDLTSTQSNFIHNQITSSITNRLINDNTSTVAVITTTPSVLQRPWADKLLAAARVQHENTRENAQVS
ncbi:unnamed protein product [Schistosoma mattheei]|uniref:Uncharacterized protein n=1 Tax=Schistosoma mattheei TaxID=31246 RepID=A0A3P8K2Z5_9TREM|nr:unnamed protein product [Schistosoma mattheei]